MSMFNVLIVTVQLANSIGFTGPFSVLKSEKIYLISHADRSCNSQTAFSVLVLAMIACFCMLVVACKLDGGTRVSPRDSPINVPHRKDLLNITFGVFQIHGSVRV